MTPLNAPERKNDHGRGSAHARSRPAQRRSALETVTGQKLKLLGGAGPIEHGITMREATEAHDDVAMHGGVLGHVGPESLHQRDRAILVGDVFGMLEWQVEE